MIIPMMNKKGIWRSQDYWVECVGFGIMIIAFLFASLSESIVMSLIVLFLCGMLFGRIWFKIRKHSKTALLLVMLFFVAGYIFGSFYYIKLFYGHWLLKISFFILMYSAGMITSYYIHHKGIIRT